jgi:hypothetical protein
LHLLRKMCILSSIRTKVCTDKKEKYNFLIYKKIQMGKVIYEQASYYMRNAPIFIHIEEAVRVI